MKTYSKTKMKNFIALAFKPFCKEVMWLVWVAVLLAVMAPVASFGQLPNQFQKVELVTGLTNAINIEFAPDGRIFIMDRYGEVLIYKTSTQTTVSAGIIKVYHGMEEGLLAIAFDPQFSSNNFVYIHYSHPTLPKNQVSRFKMNGDKLDFASEVVLLEWKSDRNGYDHAAGDMDFDSQGNLYIATGDNTNHSTYAPLDETNSNLSAERTSSNTKDLRGKILRIKPEANGTYTIPAGNLFTNGEVGRPEIYVMGARNPFKIFVDRTNTDWLFWGEVGPDANGASDLGPFGMDEINLTRKAGNYGWPYFAGKNEAYLNTYADPNFYYNPNSPVNISKWNTGVKDLPPAEPSWLDFYHRCHLVGPRYYFDQSINNPKKLPSDFNQALFYFDFNTSRIWVVKLDASGAVLSNQQFAANIITGTGFIDLKIGPDGQLYILEYGAGCCPSNVASGKLVRVDYTGINTNKAPEVSLSASVTSGSLPLTVVFSSEGTLDPDGDALTYRWDFQSDGVVDSNEKNPTFTYTQSGTFDAQLRVTDTHGETTSKSIKIYAGNHLATFQFNYPPDGGMINWEDEINYDVVVNDEEDGSTANGTISCSKLNLVPSFGHLGHSHDGITINKCMGTYYLDPTGHDAQGNDDIYYVFKVNYTDLGGLISFDQITVHPKIAEAEFYDLESNTNIIGNTDKLGGGTRAVRALSHGSYIVLAGRNLLNMNSVSYRVAATLGGTIEMRAGSPSGTLISTVAVPSTGSASNWVNVEAPITSLAGKHDLYLVFKRNSGDENLFDLNYLEFKGAGVSVDKTPPNIYSLKILSQTQLSIKFNEALDKTVAQQIANYSINNGVTVSSATLQADRKTVLLNTTTIAQYIEHELTVRNLKNESGISLSTSIVEKFTYETPLHRINSGGPQFMDSKGQAWAADAYFSGGSVGSKSFDVEGTTDDQLYLKYRYASSKAPFSYNIPVSGAGPFTVRLHFLEPYFGAPGGATTNLVGARVFHVDVEGQRVLSNYDIYSQDGAGKAVVKTFNNISVTDGAATVYFTSVNNNAIISAIEVLADATSGNQPPTVSITAPSNGASFTAGANITITANAADADGTVSKVEFFQNGTKLGEDLTAPYSFTWSSVPAGSYSLTAKATDNGTATTTSSPVSITVASGTVGCTASGTILREYWSRVSGSSISSIPLSSPPTSTSQLPLFEGPRNAGNNYGVRIRGYLCAPATGSYTFWISGDDNAELWLSTNDNPVNKVKIALASMTGYREWGKSTSQKSGLISLEAGKRYYIEALHKESKKNDHVSVGWQTA
jgi:glucose/arabinose dehydrogenase